MPVKKGHQRFLDYMLGRLPSGTFDSRLIELVFTAKGYDRFELGAAFPDEVAAHTAHQQGIDSLRNLVGAEAAADVTALEDRLREFPEK